MPTPIRPPEHTADSPRISLITATLNAAATLPKLLASVRQQTVPPWEHWVIDGGSQDATLSILAAHSDQLTGWISEPDSGIAEAMNKGISQATGDYLLFLHADDALASPDSLAQATSALDNAYGIICFPVWQQRASHLRLLRPKAWGANLNLKIGRCHQGVICQRALFATLGAFEPQWRIAMDYDFLLRAYRRGHRAKVCTTPILAITGGAGISSRQDWPSLRRRLREEQQIHYHHCPPSWHGLYAAYWALYWPYRWLRALL